MAVSYCVTLYDKGPFIAAVLRAAAIERDRTGGEILVWDDGSRDSGPDIVRDLSQRLGITLMGGPPNRGLFAATNAVLAAARFPLIKLLDADDVLVPGGTARLAAELDRFGLGFVHGGAIAAEMQEREASRLGPVAESGACEIPRNPLRTLIRNFGTNPSASLFRASALRAVLPLPRQWRQCQDYALALGLVAAGHPWGRIADTVCVLPTDRAGRLSSNEADVFRYLAAVLARQAGLGLPLSALRYGTGRNAARALRWLRRHHPLALPAAMPGLLTLRLGASLASAAACLAGLERIEALYTRLDQLPPVPSAI
ncbi:glycosyltransferase [Humitalea sp. 24SJ18S-53]|uniref:glycosyltransferase n=1 Tax=Humitalea sp. 24SJ18S-53 TaxID=3422307 RepID=UPI003D672EA8